MKLKYTTRSKHKMSSTIILTNIVEKLGMTKIYFS